MTPRTIIFLLLCNEINQITLHIYDYCIVKSIHIGQKNCENA